MCPGCGSCNVCVPGVGDAKSVPWIAVICVCPRCESRKVCAPAVEAVMCV